MMAITRRSEAEQGLKQPVDAGRPEQVAPAAGIDPEFREQRRIGRSGERRPHGTTARVHGQECE